MTDKPNPSDPFKEHGKWNFPKSPGLSHLELPGELSWDPFDGVTLELSVTHEHSILVSQLFGSSVLVHGRLANLPLITIEHALVQSLRSGIGGGDTHVTLTSYTMVKGQVLVDDVDATELINLSASMTGLLAWSNGTHIDVTHSHDGVTTAVCRPSESISFAQVDGFEAAIETCALYGQARGSFTAKDSASFHLSSPTHFSYKQGRELIWELNRFLSLALDHTVLTTSIRGKLPQNGELYPDGRPIPRFLEFHQAISRKDWKEASKEQPEYRVAIPYVNASNVTAAYLSFSQIYRIHRRALDFYFSGGRPSDSYVHQRFADMVHGLEGLDRGLNGGCFMDASEYEKVVKAMRSAVPPEVPDALRSAIKDRLKWGNGFSLRKRLKSLAAKHSYLSGILGKPNHFGDDVTDLRNDLAHAKGCDAPTREDLMRYIGMLYRVKILFKMELLSHLGYDETFRKNALRRLGAVEVAIRPISRIRRESDEEPEQRGIERSFNLETNTDGTIILPAELRAALGMGDMETKAQLQAELTADFRVLLLRIEGDC